MNVQEFFASCSLCPRHCQVNRLEGERGFCGENAQLRVASIGAHFGEEPPISGCHGSGTVFFSGCTLQCVFCQNYQISCRHVGEIRSVEEVVQRVSELYTSRHIHNVNFVTPDHFFPHTIEIISSLREQGILLPAVYNVSGYQEPSSLQSIEGVADIYLPDFKYADHLLGERLSHCQNYPSIALDALAEMVRQKGFLDSAGVEDQGTIASQGVLVRHLILPGQMQNSIDALSMLFLEFGRFLPLSLMSQYHPISGAAANDNFPELQRRITQEEFQQVYNHALDLGFEHLFVQYPEDCDAFFLPNFSKNEPFQGNIQQA